MINEYKEPEDFLMDDTFKQYCEGSSENCVVFWENWIENHPEKKKVIGKAKKLYKILSGNLKPVNEQLVFIDRQMSEEVKTKRFSFAHYGIAATLFIVFLSGLLLLPAPAVFHPEYAGRHYRCSGAGLRQ